MPPNFQYFKDGFLEKCAAVGVPRHEAQVTLEELEKRSAEDGGLLSNPLLWSLLMGGLGGAGGYASGMSSMKSILMALLSGGLGYGSGKLLQHLTRPKTQGAQPAEYGDWNLQRLAEGVAKPGAEETLTQEYDRRREMPLTQMPFGDVSYLARRGHSPGAMERMESMLAQPGRYGQQETPEWWKPSDAYYGLMGQKRPGHEQKIQDLTAEVRALRSQSQDYEKKRQQTLAGAGAPNPVTSGGPSSTPSSTNRPWGGGAPAWSGGYPHSSGAPSSEEVGNMIAPYLRGDK